MNDPLNRSRLIDTWRRRPAHKAEGHSCLKHLMLAEAGHTDRAPSHTDLTWQDSPAGSHDVDPLDQNQV